MRPLAAINAIILGSCLAISISLMMVLIVFYVLGDEYPRIDSEFETLSESLAIFTAMTIVSALSFYSLMKEHPARFAALGITLLGIYATGLYYWP
ncbi:MAG: hypothetical protein AAF660_05050 [Pseudomonadota bacterium]